MHRTGLALLVAAAPLLATAGPPEPAWLDLHDAPLRVEADGAEVEVTLSADAGVPRIRVHPIAGGAAPHLPVAIDGTTTVIGPLPADSAGPYRIEIAHPAGRDLRIRGRDLELTVAGPPVVEAGAAEPGSADPREPGPVVAGLDLDVVDSSVDVADVQAVSVRADASTVSVSRPAGPVTLQLRDTVATVTDGTAALTATAAARSSLVVEGHAAPLRIEGIGASIRLVACRGDLTLKVTDGSAELLDHSGVGAITAERSDLRGDGVELPRGTLALRGGSASLARVRANLGATLVGSTLEVDGLWGELRLEIDGGSSVEAEDLQGGVEATLLPGARASLALLDGATTAKLEDAQIEVRGGRDVTVQAVRSVVRLWEFQRLVGLQAADSEVEIDATSARHLRDVKILGRSTAILEMATPCRVQVLGVTETDPSGLTVAGCQSAYGNRPRWSGAQLDASGRRPSTAVLEIDPEATVSVEGRP